MTLNSNLTITANGFAIGDIIKFTSKNNPSDLYQFPVSNVTATSASINIGSAINSGVYNISVIRGSKEIYIGSTTLSINLIHQFRIFLGKILRVLFTVMERNSKCGCIRWS